MTINIPTSETVGLLADVIGFADTDKEFTALTCVNMRWDGEMLHTEATNGTSYGHAFWHSDDYAEGDWGGDDDPWSIILELPDAKDLVKNFKLGAKKWAVPLQVTYDQRRGRLTVTRDRDTDHSALRQGIDGRVITVDEDRFPDVEATLARRPEPENGRATDLIVLDQKGLAAILKVRKRGPVEQHMWGPTGMVDIRIGARFVGAIGPVRPDTGAPKRELAETAAV